MELVELLVAGEPEPWQAIGFEVTDGAIQVGRVSVGLEPAQGRRGIVGWCLSDWSGADLDGLATTGVPAGRPSRAARDHPNGALGIDHVVVTTPDLQRTLDALGTAGMEVRRHRDVDTPEGRMQQAFLRLGEVILEVVATPRAAPGPAVLWGLVFTVGDIESCAAALGECLGAVRDAVQPGRRIATVREQAGLGLAVALMSPDPRRRTPPGHVFDLQVCILKGTGPRSRWTDDGRDHGWSSCALANQRSA